MKQECLIELINSLGVKNFELADYCGLSAATIGRYIKGTRTPDLHSESTDKLIHGLVRCMEEHGKSNLFDEMAGTESENPYERLSAWLFENEPEKPKERKKKELQDSPFSERLATAMTLSELSNARLAAMANINPSQISRFIRGHRIPKPGSSVISQICRALSDQSIRLNGFQNPKGKGIYYLCDLHSSQPSKGIKRYDKLARTYQVTFCSYTVFPERTKFLNTFSLRHDKDNGLLSDAIHVIYVELSKLKEILKKPVADMTDLEKWAVFFRYADSRKYRNTVNEVIESKEAMQMATLTSVGSLLMNVSQDERERAVFRSRRMYQTDMQSNWNTAFDNGEKQGIAKRNLEIAKNLLDMEMTNEQIIQATGLSPEDIDKLRK